LDNKRVGKEKLKSIRERERELDEEEAALSSDDGKIWLCGMLN